MRIYALRLPICHSRVGGNPVVMLVNFYILGLILKMIKGSILFIITYTVYFRVFYVGFLWIPAFAGMTLRVAE